MKKLISEIENAFLKVRLEEGISLNMTEYLDSYSSRKEFLELAKSDERDDWTKISDIVLRQFTVTFSFTDWKGFRFYLPAYMRWCINNPTSSNPIGDHTIYSLSIHSFKSHYGKNITEILNKEQIQIVVKFLQWCCFENADYCDSEIAERYLGKLLKEIAIN